MTTSSKFQQYFAGVDFNPGYALARSSRLEVFCKKGALRNFEEFTGKHLYKSHVFTATLLKKRLWQRCFPVNFSKFLRTLFFTKHRWWLLMP